MMSSISVKVNIKTNCMVRPAKILLKVVKRPIQSTVVQEMTNCTDMQETILLKAVQVTT